jgi:hypothetical protein
MLKALRAVAREAYGERNRIALCHARTNQTKKNRLNSNQLQKKYFDCRRSMVFVHLVVEDHPTRRTLEMFL